MQTELRETGEERGGRKMVWKKNGGARVWRGVWRPPRMEGERGDLKGYAKWRLV
jgi:hypothetical protein